MSRIIRLALAGLGLAVAAACTLNPQSSNVASAPRIQVTQVPRTPNAPANAVWVLSTVGVNIRSAPDPSAERVNTIAQGARLDLTESRKVGADTWLHVKTQNGQFEGWVLDRPDLLIHREVAQHVDEAGGYSNLFPAEWQLTPGNPATMAAPAGDPEGATLLIQTAAGLDKLPATPTQPGQELHQESPVDVYGKTTFLTVYKLSAGGSEFAVKIKCKTSAYLFDYRQARPDQPNTGFFKVLLSSVIAPDCAPGA